MTLSLARITKLRRDLAEAADLNSVVFVLGELLRLLAVEAAEEGGP